ncbi:MAG: hypothetical protein H6R15_146 [Proteobacteria bacterium]|nr:hypothetical protein [Pseudomonadota bacterium]
MVKTDACRGFGVAPEGRAVIPGKPWSPRESLRRDASMAFPGFAARQEGGADGGEQKVLLDYEKRVAKGERVDRPEFSEMRHEPALAAEYQVGQGRGGVSVKNTGRD